MKEPERRAGEKLKFATYIITIIIFICSIITAGIVYGSTQTTVRNGIENCVIKNSEQDSRMNKIDENIKAITNIINDYNENQSEIATNQEWIMKTLIRIEGAINGNGN
jgi:hypothetical protein